MRKTISTRSGSPGAKQDGVLRNHGVRREGNVGEVVVFSIIDREWPTVRLGLSEKVRSFTD